MRTSATATRRAPRSRGFTLLELLVVVAIVALIAALASLSLGGIAGPQPAIAARQMADRIALAHEEAMLSGRTLGLRRTGSGLEFVAFTLDAEARRAVWTPLEDDRILGSLQDVITAPFAIALEIDGGAEAPADGAPAVLLLPDGDLTPFRLTVSAPHAPSARLIGAEDGTLRIEGNER